MEILIPIALLLLRQIAHAAAIGTLVLQSAASADSPPAARILFIGNSLTYVNDLPSIVAARS